MTVKRPVLRWHGGKWILAPWIISHFPDHRIYVEPFGGAASVLLRKPKSYAEIYNDLDDQVVNLFQVLRSDQSNLLIEQLRLTPFAQTEFFNSYEPSKCPVEAARRLIVRSYMGFGSNATHQKSGFRSNSNRSGTTPSHDWLNYPSALAAVVERMAGVCILNRDAKQVMQNHDSDQTLHYVDPPYLFATRTDARHDYAHEMTDADHLEMLEFLQTLKGSVIVSGYPSQLYDDALQGWHRVQRNALADGAKKRVEVLWMNYEQRRLI
jgi:DNA adenine methylase